MRFLALLLAMALVVSACAGPGAKSPSTEPPTRVSWNGSPKIDEESRFRPVTGVKGMVVSDDEAASRWGVEILKRGGNAIDAAVATAFALSVTRPHFASIGGGGFLLYCPNRGKCTSIDYRERAPLKATRDMYLRNGKADTHLSQDGALASGTPGVVAGLLMAHQKWGKRKRTELLSKPIEWAARGVEMSSHTEAAAEDRWSELNPAARKIWGCGSAPCVPGTRIRQADLARVLSEISVHGRDGVYRGWVARKIAREIQSAGGILSDEDFAQFQAVEREPVRARFMGSEVVSMGPPSSGGVVLLEMLGFTERADREGALAAEFGAASTIHAMAHGMRLAFADRAKHLGDPDHFKVPLAGLLDPDYLDARWKSFDPSHAAGVIEAGEPPHQGSHTTHFSVVDSQGNAVAITTTVNDNFGSGFVPEGTGIVMNNQMDDFAIQPGVPNLFGLVGAEANAVGPGKRPLSSMSPTIVRDSLGQNRIVIGAQGGPRIITGVYQALVNRLRFGMSIVDAIVAPRFHHQWKPDVLRLETFGFSQDTREKLKAYGYSLKDIGGVGRLHAIERFPDLHRVWGVSDPRSEGAAISE